MSNLSNKNPEFIFTWMIENAHLCVQKYGECLTSPKFRADPLDGTEWRLTVYPRGNVSKGYISVYLRRDYSDCDGPDELRLSYTIEIIGADDKTLASTNSNVHAFEEDECNGWDKIMSEELLDKNKDLTIRCHMVKCEPINKPFSRCYVRTKIGVDRLCFMWSVINFEIPFREQRRDIYHNHDDLFSFILTAQEDDIMLSIQSRDNDFRHLTCKISFLDVDEVEQVLVSEKHLLVLSETSKFSIIKKCDLSKYVKENTLTLKCDILFLDGKVLEEVYQCDSTNTAVETLSSVDTFSALQNDLRFLYASKKDTDIKLSADNEILFAHKAILIARSPVFSAMFGTDMIESQTGIVNIPDVEAKILETFIEFLYTGSVGKLNYEYASKLIVVAEQYQVLSLKEECALFLMSELSVDNVCGVLLISDMVQHVQLKSSAVDYIKTHVHEVLSSEDWMRLIENNPKLTTEIFLKFSSELSVKTPETLLNN